MILCEVAPRRSHGHQALRDPDVPRLAPDDQSRAIQWSIWAMTEAEPPVMRVLSNRAVLPEPQRNESEALAGEQALQKPLGVLDGTPNVAAWHARCNGRPALARALGRR
jgi:glutathione S-transferase